VIDVQANLLVCYIYPFGISSLVHSCNKLFIFICASDKFTIVYYYKANLALHHLPSHSMSKKVLLAGIVLVMIIWGISWPSSKIMTSYATPLQLSAIRFVFNTITVFVILKIAGVSFKVNKEGWLQLGIAAILLVGYNLLFFTGISKGLPGAGGILVTTITPIVTYVLAVIISRKQISKLEVVGLGLGVLAAVFLLQLWHNISGLLKSGNIFYLGCTITWAFLSRITSNSKTWGSSLGFTFWMYLLCTLMLVPLAGINDCVNILKNANGLFWGNLLFNTVLNAGSATVFYFYATTQLGAERTSSFTFIVPFSAALSSWLILGETLAWNTVVGGVLGLAAVYLINFASINARMKGAQGR
jgi:drug/metabolite transporter (DMT)-like permease